MLDASLFRPVRLPELESEALHRPPISYWRDAWHRFSQNRLALTGMAIVIAMVLVALVIGPLVSPYTYRQQLLENTFALPSAQHWLGTDFLGRDIFTRLCYGTRISLYIGVMAALLDLFIGAIYGGISGYLGGVVDDIMMRIVDILYGIPYLLIVILLLVVINPGINTIILAMGITNWVGMARLVRGQVLQLREQDYVQAAKALGASPARIIFRHLLPNTLGVMVVQLTFTIPVAIFGEAFLSFIGLGVPLPQASLGTMVNDGYQYLRIYPHLLFFPAAAISLLMLGFNFMGDGLRDALDPRLRE